MGFPVVEDVEMLSIPVTARYGWHIAAVRARDGLCGYGESSEDSPLLLSPTLLREIAGGGADETLDRVAAHASALLRDAPGPRRLARLTALGAVEAGLCDLAARQAGMPLATWLGSTSSPRRVPVYANINRAGVRRVPEEFQELARSAVDAGFRAVKCAPFDDLGGRHDRAEHGLALARAVRRGAGADIDVMIDLHEVLTTREILGIADGLAELRPRWVEDPVPLHDLEGLRVVKESIGAPLAGGELAASIAEVGPAVEAGLCDVVMPDVKHAGGVRPALALAETAARMGAQVSLHNPSGPVATAASAHVTYHCGTAMPLEYAFAEVSWRTSLTEPPELVRDGELLVPAGPGLGIELRTPALDINSRGAGFEGGSGAPRER